MGTRAWPVMSTMFVLTARTSACLFGRFTMVMSIFTGSSRPWRLARDDDDATALSVSHKLFWPLGPRDGSIDEDLRRSRWRSGPDLLRCPLADAEVAEPEG